MRIWGGPVPESMRILEENPYEFFPDNQDEEDSDDAGEDRWPGEYNAWVSYSGCAICRGNTEAGDVKAGDPFPSGHTAPPAHKRYNCNLIAVDPKTWRVPALPGHPILIGEPVWVKKERGYEGDQNQ